MREIIETATLAVFVFSILYVSIQNYQVEGSSMSPNINQGDCVLANKVAYWRIPEKSLNLLFSNNSNEENPNYLFGDPSKGDIVVFTYPKDPYRHFIKRVIATEGDRVHINDGKVYLNSLLLEEPYLDPTQRDSSNWGPNVVELGKYFVLGDNRIASNDSRDWGTISSGHIIGKYLTRYPSSICSIAPITQENLR